MIFAKTKKLARRYAERATYYRCYKYENCSLLDEANISAAVVRLTRITI
jgi:hypothetical protein